MRNYLKTCTLHATTAQITPCCPVRFNLPELVLEGMIWDLVTMCASKLRLAMFLISLRILIYDSVYCLSSVL